jgi:hypothetical protein
MTIEFNCPQCGALIAFDSKHAGKCAKCLACGQRFLIPAESFQKPKKVEPEPEPREDPIPGFYHAVFVDSFRVFIDPQNVTTLAFVIAVVCFRFFLARACCLNYVANFVIWGWLFGFYQNVISHTAIDDDQLPEIELGTSITFVLYILGPFITFFFTLFVLELPFILGLSLVQDQGITFSNLFSGSTGVHRLLQALLLGGLFLFPAAILAIAAGGTSGLLRPDYLLAPLPRAFLPYVTAVALLAATCLLEMHTTQYDPDRSILVAANLGMNLLVQVLAIFAMRSIGLYYRHYGCYFKW